MLRLYAMQVLCKSRFSSSSALPGAPGVIGVGLKTLIEVMIRFCYEEGDVITTYEADGYAKKSIISADR